MNPILNIDTSLETASVCIAEQGKTLELLKNEEQKDHAAWLHVAIQQLLANQGMTAAQLAGVAVSIGPGSYTGLRVGLASAKGLCYALGIPLLTVNTLEMMALAVKEEAEELICPLIDARRMEVFTALYDKILREIISPKALLIDENSFADTLTTRKILFCGNGRKKLEALISAERAQFTETQADATHLAQLSYNHYSTKNFANLVLLEPLYIKEFYSPKQIG
ncbi:MAG: tRNA (adenosine(37)-N6)-threonylcarbamoyltransferase complex dimerization subunit type 1 TsaB [Chitinophagaceae bacterium]